MAIRTCRDLDVFRESYAAALDVSRLVKRFPPFEQYELASQLRRAARSIPANIVEGWGKRASTPEFKRFLQISIGSCDETRMWLDMSKDEGYINEKDCQEIKERYNRIGAMLSSLWKQWRGAVK
ncbi:MAG: four helix bundle protein [Acidobacteriia bacterium]|nr:four helix bundle protein [Terriglobia bacterium]